MSPGFWRRHRTTLALPVLAAIALVAFFVLDRGRVTSREATRREGQLFPAWRKADIGRVIVHQAGRAPLDLERDTGDAGELDFHLLAPVASLDIDAVAVDHLLGELEFASVVRKLDAEPAQFGEVQNHVEVDMATVHYAFDVGGEAAVPEGAHYLRLTRADGAGAGLLGTYVVPGTLVTELAVSAHEYRSKQVVPYLSIALSALEVRTAGRPPLRLERMDSVSFRITSSQVRASRKRIDVLWAALAETRLESFAETDADEAALLAAVATPSVVVVLEPSEGPPAELRYGGECPGHPDRIVLLRTTPTRALGCVPREAHDGYDTTAEVLADRGSFAITQDELAEFVVTAGALRLDLAREGGGYRRRAPEPKLLDANEQASVDTALGFLFAENGVLAPTRTPAFVSSAHFELASGHGAPGGQELVERVDLGRCDGAPCVSRPSDGSFLLVPAAAAVRMVPTLDWTRSVDLSLPTERAQALDLECGTPQHIVQDGAGYKYALPHAELDTSRVLELVDALRHFRATGFVSADADVAADFALAGCQLEITPTADAGVVRMELGWDAAGSHVYGRIAGRPGVWLAERELRTQLERIYLRRSFWNDDTPIESVSVQRGATRVTWGADDAGARLGAVADFRAVEVKHLGLVAGEGFETPWLTLEAIGAKTDGSPAAVRRLTIAKEPSATGALVRFEGVAATFSASPEALAPLLP